MSDFRKAKRRVLTEEGYELLSYATSSESIEMSNGTDLQTKMNSIDTAVDTKVDSVKIGTIEYKSGTTVTLPVYTTDEVDSTFGADIALTIDTTTYKMTLVLKDNNGNTLSSKEIDFPIESMVVDASYANGTLTLTLQNGNTLDVDISSIISGLVPNTRTIAGVDLKDNITATELRTALNVADGANKTTVDSTLSSTSTNPVQNKVINSALAGKANTSHGNHVPTTETANNAKFLRNDNTWATVTPANIGAATSDHTHSSYANQNAFSNVKVDNTTIAADTTTDTLTLAGSNVTITPDATNDKVTIGITKDNVTTALGYTPPTTNTTYDVVSTTANGLCPKRGGTTTKFLRDDGTWAVPPDTKYTLPTASSSTLGGVKTTSTVTSNSGYTACPIISGVPYYKDTTYTLSSITGTLAVAKGGTGATTAAGALTNLGLTATATELNYCDGVTSNIQTQIDTLNSNLTTVEKSIMSSASGTINKVKSGCGYQISITNNIATFSHNLGFSNKDSYAFLATCTLDDGLQIARIDNMDGNTCQLIICKVDGSMIASQNVRINYVAIGY